MEGDGVVGEGWVGGGGQLMRADVKLHHHSCHIYFLL